MQASIELVAGDGSYGLRVTAAGEVLPLRPVRHVRGAVGDLLVADDAGADDAAARELADKVEHGTASPAELADYGRLLFGAAFDPAAWTRLVERAGTDSHLELAVETPADLGAQALHWEALHDGSTFIAAKGAARAGRPPLPVAIVRLVRSPAPEHLLKPVVTITQLPKVLFAVGSRLTDPRVRPGAEFMGILRQLELEGGAIQARTLESASRNLLVHELRRFQPDVLHLVGHGRSFPAAGVKLQLQADPGDLPGDEWVTAEALLDTFRQSGHIPTVVVLSACQTADAPAGGPEAEDETLNALPFAGRLVAGGVPVTVAMAGDIADTACRVFTRALTMAVESGTPLIRAIISGRSAAFYERQPESLDWIRPVMFLRDDLFKVPPVQLVDDTAIRAIKHRVGVLDLARRPVFWGRQEFLDAFDRVLDPVEQLNTLVAYTANPQLSYGGMRLLRELGARAVRAGWLPILLGPFDQIPPGDAAALAQELTDKIEDVRAYLGLAPASGEVAALGGDPTMRQLATALRRDLERLGQDLLAAAPGTGGPPPRAVLLCHRVDLWVDVVEKLLAQVGPAGFGAGATPLPLVLTGAVGDERSSPLGDARKNGAPWIQYLPLARFQCAEDNPEDILAYQWWLLNPPRGQRVYVPRRGSKPSWQRMMRAFMMGRAVYEETLFEFAGTLVPDYFVDGGDDNAVISAYTKAAP